jgi:histidyl-tRNA synthetase
VQHRGELQFPFKRFQIQPVWRADRPQKGRYREFYQCDADIIGSESLLNEIELLSLIDTVFASFGIRIAIKVNNRKILSAIAEVVDASDKLDKIGWGNVCQELLDKGLSQQAIDKLSPLLEFKGSNDDKIDALEKMVGSTEIGRKGIDELKEVISGIDTLGHKCGVEIDITLARGLNYYTGTILEVKALDVEIGSITGGGRYDNLTGVFGMPGVSGVGISFGADRIYDVLNQLNLYPDEISESVKVMFLNLGKDEAMQSAKAIKVLQDNGIAAKLYPDIAKMKKQMGIADSEKIPYIAIIGSDELTDNSVTLKDMKSGEQKRIPLNTLVENLK